MIVMVACGGSGDGGATPDPFAGLFREGIYTRTDGDKTYEIKFGVSLGSYVLLGAAEERRGSYTLVTTPGGDRAFAFIDDPEFAAKCSLDQEPGIYVWEFKDDKLSLDQFDEKCDERREELNSKDWRYQGPLPSPS